MQRKQSSKAAVGNESNSSSSEGHDSKQSDSERSNVIDYMNRSQVL